MKKSSLLLAAFALFQCGSPPPVYRPLSGGVGYTDANIGKDKYEIMFHGTTEQDELTAKKFAMVRAAEIGKQNNFAYFRVDNSKSREKDEKEVIKDTEARSYGDPYYPRYPYGWHHRVTERRTVTRVEKRPVVKIIVSFQNEDCGDCLSVDAKLSEAASQGILNRD